MEAGPQVRSIDRLFSVFFASLAEATSFEAPPGGGAQRVQGLSFSSFFLFSARLAGQDAPVSLPSGCRPFSLPVRMSGSPRRRPALPPRKRGWSPSWRRRRRDPFFSGLGGARKSVFAGGADGGAGREGPSPSLLSPPFSGVFFPCQATRVAVLETELRGETWTQGFQARYRASFRFPAPVAPARPTLARSARSWPV